jgi:hypothetical protein
MSIEIVVIGVGYKISVKKSGQAGGGRGFLGQALPATAIVAQIIGFLKTTTTPAVFQCEGRKHPTLDYGGTM